MLKNIVTQVVCGIIFLFIIVGCAPTNKPVVTHTNKETPIPKETAPSAFAHYDTYRPEVGMKKHFVNGPDLLYTYDVVAEDSDYVQIIITLNGAPTTQIYRWTADEMTLVYEQVGLADQEGTLLEEF
ncbi:hypothetical protein EJF36_21195 [Bacillus sp. HMF5848]|nr:hypothetical protein [Bacillus sp. HMF5848]RSK23921.1 hypothetical protein EJF36_21195 [Bacillus sp. HMF5848]